MNTSDKMTTVDLTNGSIIVGSLGCLVYPEIATASDFGSSFRGTMRHTHCGELEYKDVIRETDQDE